MKLRKSEFFRQELECNRTKFKALSDSFERVFYNLFVVKSKRRKVIDRVPLNFRDFRIVLK